MCYLQQQQSVGSRQTHPYAQMDTRQHRQIDRLTQQHTRWADRTNTGGSEDSLTGTGCTTHRKHTSCPPVDSTHLPAQKHFNHLTANYSGARQSRTETHTSLPLHSQMAVQAGSKLPVFTLPVGSILAQVGFDMGEKAGKMKRGQGISIHSSTINQKRI